MKVIRKCLLGFALLSIDFSAHAEQAPGATIQFAARISESSSLRSWIGLRRIAANQLSGQLGFPINVGPISFVRMPEPDRDTRDDWNESERRAARWVHLEYPAVVNPEHLRARLKESGLFEKVGRMDHLKIQVHAPILEPLNTCSLSITGCAGNDPSRHQWWTQTVNLPGALDAGKGRTLLGLVDGGVNACHSDILHAIRPSLLGRQTTSVIVDGYSGAGCPNSVMDETGTLPNDSDLAYVGHGLHVSGLMVAAQNEVGGIGTCPGCGLTMIRTRLSSGYPVVPMATAHVVNSGPSAINFSIAAPGDPTSIEEDREVAADTWTTEVAEALAFDIVIVASIGNDYKGQIDNTASNYIFPAAYPGVLSVGATDIQDERWHESRIALRGGVSKHPETSVVSRK